MTSLLKLKALNKTNLVKVLLKPKVLSCWPIFMFTMYKINHELMQTPNIDIFDTYIHIHMSVYIQLFR